jgi:signal transduction histidine kinase
VNLGELLNEICEQWKKAISDKGLTLRRARDQPLPTITTDKVRLRQILDNLIGNALKFTTAGHITAGARACEDTVEVWVQDTGSGIDPADQERIFDEFQQIEQTPDPRFGGVGLGLAVCKKLVTLMKGEITVESLPAQGSKFTVRLPRQGNERQDSAATKGRSAA